MPNTQPTYEAAETETVFFLCRINSFQMSQACAEGASALNPAVGVVVGGRIHHKLCLNGYICLSG